MRFNVALMDDLGFEGMGEHTVAGGEGRIRIATRDVGSGAGISLADGIPARLIFQQILVDQRSIWSQRHVDVVHGGKVLIGHFHRSGGLGSQLRRFRRHQRHRLAHMTHLIPRQHLLIV
ncbi:MAG: hypothetical protein BWY79_01349 [Actinobacteria bacterium ADurb.Bin444]|nr:MAG: hypothetical protein BWY79_01349 [Actinobacteria bacterium ADurb.Bin444]